VPAVIEQGRVGQSGHAGHRHRRLLRARRARPSGAPAWWPGIARENGRERPDVPAIHVLPAELETGKRL